MVKVIGGDLAKLGPFVTLEDIEFMIEVGKQEGVIKKSEEEMFLNIFEFSDTIIREIMIPRTDMVAISANKSYGELVQLVINKGYSRLPVYGKTVDDILGVLYAKDLLAYVNADNKSFDIHKILRKCFFVPETMKISTLLQEFKKRKIHLAIVVDEYGGTSGLVTFEDIIEELVGEIQDEYDMEEKQVKPLGSGKYLVDARISIFDINETLKMDLPEADDYETLGGFLISRIGHLPSTGTKFKYNTYLFTVKDATEKSLLKVEVEKQTDLTPNVSSQTKVPENVTIQ